MLLGPCSRSLCSELIFQSYVWGVFVLKGSFLISLLVCISATRKQGQGAYLTYEAEAAVVWDDT